MVRRKPQRRKVRPIIMSFATDTALKKALIRKAKELKVSISETIRILLREGLSKKEE